MRPSSRTGRAWPVVLALAVALAAPAGVRAIDYTWNRDANDVWNATLNWLSAGGTFPTSDGDTARFGNFITAARTVSMNGTQTVGALRFESVSADPTIGYTLSGGVLILGSNGVPPTIEVSGGDNTAGNQIFATQLDLPNNTPFTITNNGKVGSTTLTFANTAALQNAGGGNNIAITLAGASNTVVHSTLGGGVTGLTKSGIGSLELTANNSYNGPTNITGGTLLVSNPTSGSATSNGTVTISPGATLAGGNVNNTLGRMQSNETIIRGTLSPGLTPMSLGQLQISNQMTFDGGSYTVKIGGTADDNNSRSQVLMQNDLRFTNGASLMVTKLGSPAFVDGNTYQYTIITGFTNLSVNGLGLANGPVSGIPINVSGFASGTEFSLLKNGNNLVLQYQPVPEPTAVLTVFAAGLGGAAYIRRRRAVTAAARCTP